MECIFHPLMGIFVSNCPNSTLLYDYEQSLYELPSRNCCEPTTYIICNQHNNCGGTIIVSVNLSLRRSFNADKAVFKTFSVRQTVLKTSESVTQLFPKDKE